MRLRVLGVGECLLLGAVAAPLVAQDSVLVVPDAVTCDSCSLDVSAVVELGDRDGPGIVSEHAVIGRSDDGDYYVSTLAQRGRLLRFSPDGATRVFVRFQTRFWEGEDLNGWGTTDWPEELWHPTWDAPGPEGVLLTYVRGTLANELDGLDGDARVARVLAHWEEFLPGASNHFASGTSHSWQLDPWSRAAWASPTPTQDRELTSALARPEGPLHFAGEHVSGARGWMNGALESGLRAVMEIDSG